MLFLASLYTSKYLFCTMIKNEIFTFNEISEQREIQRSCTTVCVTDITSALKMLYYALLRPASGFRGTYLL